MTARTASVRLVETVEEVTDLFQPLGRRLPLNKKMEVLIDNVLYRTDQNEPITLRLNDEGKLAVVTVPLVVREFEVRRIYK